MTGTLEALLDALVDPLRALGSFDERIGWPYLVGAAALASVVWFVRHRGRVSLERYLFAPSLWRHRSAWFDVRLLLVRAPLEALLFAPFLVSSVGLAAGTLAILTASMGAGPWPGAPAWLAAASATVSSFVAEDFSRYVVHWAAHRWAPLWALHKVHHGAEVLTPLTVLRTHPLEALLVRTVSALAVGVSVGLCLWLFRRGVSVWQIGGVHALAFVWNVAGANLRHSHVWLSYGRRLEHVFISPAQHQLHHSRDPAHRDRNFGAVFALWDWMFGTLLVAPPRRPPLRFGLQSPEEGHDHRVRTALVRPLREMGAALLGSIATAFGGRRSAKRALRARSRARYRVRARVGVRERERDRVRVRVRDPARVGVRVGHRVRVRA
ncbi:MAG: sterol desaturase family protein [Myxococcota bacterium]|nr:sterol desaturase family protein [Myxococcota bacterium]MDW8363988.1 sterol desaturase family protein [Myxococcales bacterium]